MRNSSAGAPSSRAPPPESESAFSTSRLARWAAPDRSSGAPGRPLEPPRSWGSRNDGTRGLPMRRSRTTTSPPHRRGASQGAPAESGCHPVVVTHWKVGRHRDHRIASELVRDACFLSALKKLDVPGDPFRPRKLVHATAFREDAGPPDFVVDISEHTDAKLEAIKAYESQFQGISQQGKPSPAVTDRWSIRSVPNSRTTGP